MLEGRGGGAINRTGLLCLLLCLWSPDALLADTLQEQAAESLSKGVEYFYSTNAHGGYVYYVTPDLSRRWGERPADADTIEVQPPGTPAVGQAYLSAYRATGDSRALAAAVDAARALIRGQNVNGGWDHTIDFSDLTNERVSFDDNQTQSAISFLMAMDQAIESDEIAKAVRRALDMMIATQLDNGGWPHMYPEQGNYHDYATFNDGGINDCIRVMIEAHGYYGGDAAIEQSLRRAARFMMISQLPPPQSGWAQQYNEFLQPAWARTFEPPAVCPAVTVKNIETLIDLYVALDDRTLLEPIPDAVRWLRDVRLDNGKWARFVALGTNEALYYDRGRIRVDNLEELHPERRFGYNYQTDLEAELVAAEKRFAAARKSGGAAGARPTLSRDALAHRRDELATAVRDVIASQDAAGAWITRNDRFRSELPAGVRWDGQYTVMDRVSSAVFIENVELLSEYLELSALLD